MVLKQVVRGAVCGAALAALATLGLMATTGAEAGQASAPVRVGGAVKPPVRVKVVNPTYPPNARQSRTQGVVILEVVIGSNGKVTSTKVLKSLPFLDAAAIDAVKQWEYKPPLVDDKPTPVIMTVPVNFKLD